jgi:Planctomycete cytochrome C
MDSSTGPITAQDASMPDAAQGDAAPAAPAQPDGSVPSSIAQDAGAQVAAMQDASAAADGGASCTDMPQPTAAAMEVVFQRSCGLSQSCHAGSTPQLGLDLSSLDGVFRTAVGKPSKAAPSEMLIVAGNPDRSYLLKKIRGAAGVGTPMPPPPAAALCAARVQALEAWIRAGALR